MRKDNYVIDEAWQRGGRSGKRKEEKLTMAIKKQSNGEQARAADNWRFLPSQKSRLSFKSPFEKVLKLAAAASIHNGSEQSR